MAGAGAAGHKAALPGANGIEDRLGQQLDVAAVALRFWGGDGMDEKLVCFGLMIRFPSASSRGAAGGGRGGAFAARDSGWSGHARARPRSTRESEGARSGRGVLPRHSGSKFRWLLQQPQLGGAGWGAPCAAGGGCFRKAPG